MESKNQNVWIAVIVALVIACCCALAMAVGAVAWLTSRYADTGVEPLNLGNLSRERLEESFEVGQAPNLEITNFAGSVTVRSGEGNVVRVVATKKATSEAKLDRIQVRMTEADGRVVIKTKKLLDQGNASVDLEITAPAGSRVSVDTGAGTVVVRDIAGRIDINSGAGSVDVRGAAGPVRVDLGAGQITYEGAPSGDCRFQTGAGEIALRLPGSPNVRIDLGTGLGAVDVDFDVDGRVSPRRAEGVIGDGSQGSIFAHTGVGGVRVERW